MFNQKCTDIGLLIPRLFIGFSMAFSHGIGKLPPSEKFVGMVAGMGFPMPAVFAWSASLSEFLGGILLAVGLFTRPATFLIGSTMAVAAFMAHGKQGFAEKEMALLYLAFAILYFFVGPGKFSLDYKLFKR